MEDINGARLTRRGPIEQRGLLVREEREKERRDEVHNCIIIVRKMHRTSKKQRRQKSDTRRRLTGTNWGKTDAERRRVKVESVPMHETGIG